VVVVTVVVIIVEKWYEEEEEEEKIHLRTGHEGPDGEEMYSSTLSLPSALS